MSRTRLAAVVLVLAFALGQGTARAETPSSSRLSALAGWWNAELEFETSFGLYIAGGGAWGGMVYDRTEGNAAANTFPVEAALGYRYHLSDRLSLGGGLRGAIPVKLLGECEGGGEGGCTGFGGGMLEAGLRYQWPVGLVAGLNVPMLGLISSGDQGVILYFPFSLAASQLYAGWTWEF